MVESTWEKYSAGFTDADVALVERMRSFIEPLDGVTEHVTSSQIAWKRTRTFATGYVKSHYLEISIDLTRTDDHPRLKEAFHTTKKVVTHRFTIHSLDELDGSIKKLVREAWETVGPGFR